ncbi:hypothetical protein [Methylomonas sp. AM2-LC]|uniref:hypothetical protein n=1 Tax=Methylomonas sp. AM2-LC TaxID=3153301 RepID=UPI0032633AE0
MTTQYYEAVAEIPVDHCLRLQLPPEIPIGLVRVAIIYDRDNDNAGQSIKNLLGSMPDVCEVDDYRRNHDLGREALHQQKTLNYGLLV